jgi:hypothetical protein
MSVSATRYWTLQHNLPTPNQKGGLLAEIDLNSIWTTGLLRKSGCSETENYRDYPRCSHIVFNPVNGKKSQTMKSDVRGGRAPSPAALGASAKRILGILKQCSKSYRRGRRQRQARRPPSGQDQTAIGALMDGWGL